MPLGKLSKKQIESAYKILTEAQVCHSWSRFVLFALSYGFPPFSYRDRVVFSPPVSFFYFCGTFLELFPPLHCPTGVRAERPTWKEENGWRGGFPFPHSLSHSYTLVRP